MVLPCGPALILDRILFTHEHGGLHRTKTETPLKFLSLKPSQNPQLQVFPYGSMI